jgi:hypothetical protein
VEAAKARSLTTSEADRAPAAERAQVRSALVDGSNSAFREGIGIGGALVVLGGIASLIGITNRRRPVPCEECPGGAWYGASEDHAHPAPEREPLAA